MAPLGRLARGIRDDEAFGPGVLERLLATMTVVMLVVLVMTTMCHGMVTMMGQLSGQLAVGR